MKLVVYKKNIYEEQKPKPNIKSQIEQQREACLNVMNELSCLIKNYQQIDFTKQKKILANASLLFDQEFYQEALVLMKGLRDKINLKITFAKEHPIYTSVKAADMIVLKDVDQKQKAIPKTAIKKSFKSTAMKAPLKPVDSLKISMPVAVQNKASSCAKLGLFTVAASVAVGVTIYNEYFKLSK